jgi:glycosyltransferase involved in cell wall biosynthesis
MTETIFSVVVPAHDEQDNLRELQRRLARVLDELGEPAEVILVDDGSRDETYLVMLDLNRLDARFKIVRLSRNFGHQVAITAGIDVARGAAVIVMDGDLQHPPETIHAFVEQWRRGYEIVYGVMQTEQVPWFKRTMARLFYRLLGRLSDVDVPVAAGDFRLVDRSAVEAFVAMRERNRYVRGMFSWVGFRQIGVPYVCAPRGVGRSKYTLGRMFRLAADGILSFSDVPLRLALRTGYIVSLLSVVFGLSAIGARIGGAGVPGWASLVVVTTFIGGFQLIVLGLVGMYVGRIYDEVRQRPLYFVREFHGFDQEETSARQSDSASRPALH